MPAQDQILIPVGRLQLVFQWHGDRYGHRLEPAADDAQATMPGPVFLESVEGSPDDAWPISPPLQECHVEPRPDGRSVALLVGRAGKSHWSLSVLCDPASSGLLFEAACRLTGEPQWLGSRYRAGGAIVAETESGETHDQTHRPDESSPALLLEATATGERWRLFLPQSPLVPQSLDKPAASRAGAIDIAAIDRAAIDRAAIDRAWGAARTVQWSYQVRLAN